MNYIRISTDLNYFYRDVERKAPQWRNMGLTASLTSQCVLLNQVCQQKVGYYDNYYHGFGKRSLLGDKLSVIIEIVA